ncbi:MAG: LysM peptidoglycan-binding domain-containing protein [Defluviitaleaceae bacterium]|nr:LysM peptidoglycan-binding domain-containing protein [Defluviitaleaceae bacterium]
MNSFQLPTNIRQIGTAGDGLKIYVEDYVCSYLRQYAESGGHTEKVAFLVGKYMVIDGEAYVFVSGAIQGKFSEYRDNMESFTDASFDNAMEELDKYFPGCEILGWMQSQPGYGIYLNPSYADYHMANFTRPYQLLFVMDPVEKLNMFYSWNGEMTGINEAAGYFVYYDQNKGMQEYMNDNRITRAKIAKATNPLESVKTPMPAAEKKEEPLPATRLRLFENDRTTTAHPEKPAKAIPASRAGRFMGGVKTTPAPEKKEGRSIEDVRRLSNLLIGLCAVLFVTSFVMGAGLLQSDGRIATLESAIITMDNNNLIIADQIRQMSALPVFAQGGIGQYADHAMPPPTQNQQEQQNQPPTQNQPLSSEQNQPAQPPQQQQTPPEQPPAEPPTPLPTEPEQDNIFTQDPDQAVAVWANVPETYTIQPGDSLLQISRIFFGDTSMVDRIMELNNIADANLITVGQVIVLPRY